MKQQKVQITARNMQEKRQVEQHKDQLVRIQAMIERRGLVSSEFLQVDPEVLLIPTVMQIPMTVARNPEVKGLIDDNFVRGCQHLHQNEYIKAFKAFRQCEEDFKHILKLKKTYVQLRTHD